MVLLDKIRSSGIATRLVCVCRRSIPCAPRITSVTQESSVRVSTSICTVDRSRKCHWIQAYDRQERRGFVNSLDPAAFRSPSKSAAFCFVPVLMLSCSSGPARTSTTKFLPSVTALTQHGVSQFHADFTWCNKDGVNYCAQSIDQHIHHCWDPDWHRFERSRVWASRCISGSYVGLDCVCGLQTPPEHSMQRAPLGPVLVRVLHFSGKPRASRPSEFLSQEELCFRGFLSNGKLFNFVLPARSWPVSC